MNTILKVSDILAFFIMLVVLVASPYLFAQAHVENQSRFTDTKNPPWLEVWGAEEDESEDSFQEYLYRLYSKLIVL